MPVTGGIKFFDLNLADSKTGADAEASSGDSSASFILDRNQYTVWRSVGSDDTTTETIEVTLSASETFSRLFLIRHNFKEFTVQYWDGGWTDFSNIVGVNGETSSIISETDYAANTAYYEFDAVATDRILITSTKTQTADEEKFLNSFVVTTELGTLQGYPVIADATKDKKLRKSILLNGRSFIDKSLEVFRTTINFKNYPPGLDSDLNLLLALFDRDDNFFVWLCGGRDGEPYFRYQLRGFRLEDLILMQTINIFKDRYRKNIYTSMVNMKLQLEEAG